MSDSEKCPRVTWTDAETRTLIRLWERHLQDLRRQKRNRAVYEAIAAALQSHGYHKTRKQVHSKVENLTQQYRRFARQGLSTASWPFFREIDRFLGHNQSSNPEITQDFAHDEEAFCDIIVPEVIHVAEVSSGLNDSKEVGKLNFDNNNCGPQGIVPKKHCTLAGSNTGLKQENLDDPKRRNTNSDSAARRENSTRNAWIALSSGSSSEEEECGRKQRKKRTRNDVLQKLVEEQQALRRSIEMSLRRQLELQERQLQAQEDSNMLKRELIGCFREFLQRK